MASAGRLMKALLVLIILFGMGYVFVAYYSYIFAKSVVGTVERIERVELNVSLLQAATDKKGDSHIAPELYSFAVAIREKNSSEIYTASAMDRQWAVATNGQCAEAKFYPYPPWNFEKSGTFFNARLIRLWDCSQE